MSQSRSGSASTAPGGEYAPSATQADGPLGTVVVMGGASANAPAGTLRSLAAWEPATAANEPAFDALYVRRPRRWLAVILAAYMMVAVLFALLTPAWQAPDEPAHYNYIRHIAETGSLPVLRMGDYDQEELLFLLAQRFPATASIDGLRYESYQLPLYYLTAVPIYWFSDGSLAALRIFSIFLGLVSLLFLYLCLELVFPGKPLIPLGATAFAALLPMHVAVSASVTNDVLAELLTMASALALLHWMRPYFYRLRGAAPGQGVEPVGTQETLRLATSQHDRNHLLLLGTLLGMGLLTKIYAYALLPMFSAVILWTIWRQDPTWRGVGWGLRKVAIILLPALLLAAPAWIRNMAIYGIGDPLALRWHDIVVAGQPTTASWIETYGSVAYFERAFSLTFRSFWGVFGWLGVFMDERVYRATLFFTAVLFLGLLWASVRMISGKPDTDMDSFQTLVIAIFGLMLVAVALSYVWYNLKFVQHQGRYFFWGMLAIGTVVALAWREVLHPLQGTITGLLMSVLGLSLAIGGLIGEEMDEWGLLMVLGMAAFLLLQPLLLLGTPYPHPWRRLRRFAWQGLPSGLLPVLRFVAWALPFLLLFALNLWVPFAFILPQLAG